MAKPSNTNAAPSAAPTLPTGNVVRTRTNRQTKTNVVLVAAPQGKAHTVACMGPQGALVTTAVLAVMAGATPAVALPNGTANQHATLAQQAAQALANSAGHNTAGVQYASKALAKPSVYTPAAWCAACAAIAQQALANAQQAVASNALPSTAPQA
jgi:hypothetical protein